MNGHGLDLYSVFVLGILLVTLTLNIFSLVKVTSVGKHFQKEDMREKGTLKIFEELKTVNSKTGHVLDNVLLAQQSILKELGDLKVMLARLETKAQMICGSEKK